MIAFIDNTDFKEFLISWFLPVFKQGLKSKRKAKKKLGPNVILNSSGLEKWYLKRREYKITLRQWLWRMYGSLIFYFDFFSQINNSGCFKAFLLPLNAQHFSPARINMGGSSCLGACPSIWECLWPLRIHLTSDLFTLRCYDLALKPLALGQACLCSELISFLDSYMQNCRSLCVTPFILIHQFSSNS